MNFIDLTAALVTLAALFSYLNHRFIRLPVTIGVMLIGLVFSLLLLIVGRFAPGFTADAAALLAGIDFDATVLEGLLSFLLFAGALHINLADLARQKWVIGLLATIGLLLSTTVVGLGSWFLLGLFGIELSFTWCLLFGALISPTDPIAVLGVLKQAGAPKTLETKITGESLFNDGVAVVVFLVLLDLVSGNKEPTFGAVATLLAQEALGGVVFGLVLGYLAYRMLKSVDNYQVEVLITLALVLGGYSLAGALHLSGPIAIVVAGLMIGNQGRLLAMSDTTRQHLDTFWELVDEILNAVLFLLIGLEVLILTFTGHYLLAGALMIPLVLVARLASVSLSVTALDRFHPFTPGAIPVLTWGGLRGGISVALALAIPASAERDVIVAITYTVVVFSIIAQGLTLAPLVRRLVRQA